MQDVIVFEVTKDFETGQWTCEADPVMCKGYLTDSQIGDLGFELKDILEAGVAELFHRRQQAEMGEANG